MKVEIAIYRRHLNPSWDLSDQESRTLQSRLHALPRVGIEASPGAVVYPVLHVCVDDPRSGMRPHPGEFFEVELDASLVRLWRADGTIEYRRDARQTIARWLLSIAQGRTDEVIRQVVLARIAARCT